MAEKPKDPKSGQCQEYDLPFIHLCPHADCQCQDDILAGIVASTGPMLPPVPDWILGAAEEASMAFKRPIPSSAPKPMPNAWTDKGDKSDYPNIFAFLTETVYDDGKPRMTGSISLFTQLGVLKASVSDKDNKRVCYLEASNLMELIQLIDMSICAEDTVWKDQQPYRQPTF